MIIPQIMLGVTLMMYHGGEVSSKYDNMQSCKAVLKLLLQEYNKSKNGDNIAFGTGFCIPDQDELNKMRMFGEL